MYVVRGRRVKIKKMANVFIGRKNYLKPYRNQSPLLLPKLQPKKKRKKIKDESVTSDFWRKLGYSECRMESVLSLKVNTKQI